MQRVRSKNSTRHVCNLSVVDSCLCVCTLASSLSKRLRPSYFLGLSTLCPVLPRYYRSGRCVCFTHKRCELFRHKTTTYHWQVLPPVVQKKWNMSWLHSCKHASDHCTRALFKLNKLCRSHQIADCRLTVTCGFSCLRVKRELWLVQETWPLFHHNDKYK